MTKARQPLGDSHNFGRRVTLSEDRVHKPRTVVWERLLLAADSPLRERLREVAEDGGLGRDAFDFLPELRFFPSKDGIGGEVERVALDALPPLKEAERRVLATVVGRTIALFAWLGVTDLHWENLVLGRGRRGQLVFGPLDVEMILGDFGLPTETKLLPDADPEYATICRHAAGVRRVLPYLGKPVGAALLVEMAAAYRGTLTLLDRHAKAIAEVFATLPELADAPIRVCLRGTGEYVQARAAPPWPPLLDEEEEQLARGDIPYFFRLYGRPGIHYYGDASLRRMKTLPLEGDVPQLDPVLPVKRGLTAPSRRSLREEGLFTLLGAFDHKGLTGEHESDTVKVRFGARTLVITTERGEELESRRNLKAFVGSVYLPCRCGEVRTVFVPPVTACRASR